MSNRPGNDPSVNQPLDQPLVDLPQPAALAEADTRFFGHPRGLSTLFFTEMWERFSFYGLRAILILFMTASVAAGGLGFDVPKSAMVYGTYMSLVYMLSLPGGWIADRLIGQRKAVLYGGILIMFGHICLAITGLTTFYLGLMFIIFGTGLLKPNVSAMVGQLYAQEDARRDAGFSIFYMGINLGAFIAPLVVGTLAQAAWFRSTLAGWGISPEKAWHFGFGAAAVGMLCGLIQYTLGSRFLGTAGLHPAEATPEQQRTQRRQFGFSVLALVAVVAVVAILAATGTIQVSPEGVGKIFGWLLGITVAGFFVWLLFGGSWTSEERKRLVVIFVLFFAAAVFWSVFEQAGSTLNLFAQNNTDNHIFGWSYPASFFQSLNSLFIIILAPVFAWFWIKLGKHDPSSPAKFAAGLFFTGLSFAVLIGGAELAAGGNRVSPWWLVLVYLLQTIGELSLSPVGLSAMTKLAPARIVGLMMGVWFLATSVGEYIGGLFAGLYGSLDLPKLFGAIAIYTFIAAGIMALLVKPIKRMLARG